MNQGLKSNRKRGVILTSQGREKLQRARQKAENQENFGVKYTFEELSDRTRLTPRTVARAFEGKTKVDKLSLEQIFRAFSLELVESDYHNPQPNFEELEQEISNNHQDWGEAVDVSFFYGRAEDLAELKQWILKERCRLVGLFGIGGIGKTSLSVKLAEQLQDKFEYVIWRSLRCAPPINKVLAKFIQFVSNEQETEADLPGDLDSQVLMLIGYLRACRCLLVLDNAETIMQHGDLAGRYRQGYEGYGELIRRIGEATHQSCLVLTSREKPQDFVVLEGEALPVRSLQLHGLPESESREIFRSKGFFSGSDEDWKILIQQYAGNPLALKIMATTIQELLEGDISEFLKQSPAVVGSLRNLLEQQFERLSDLEKEIMYWLAINRENATLAKLREDILSPGAKSKLLESLEGLGRRSLIEKCTKSFTLQTIVMEYVTDHLIERICQEIEGFKTESSEQPANLPEGKSLTLQLLRSHALIKPLGKDYVRDAQIRCILEPIADQLLTQLESKTTIQNQLNQILATLRGKSYQWIGYAGGNIFNLLCQIQTDLRGYNFSHLTLWQADFRKVNLHQATLAYSDLSKSVFDEAIGSILAVAFSPNGKLLAIGDFNNKICLWRVADGKQLVTCQGHTGWVVSVAFSPDSRTLASGSADNTVKLWDIQGHCLKTWQEHTKAIQSVAFSPQGQILASGSDDQTIRLWDTSTGECLKILPGHTQPVRAIAFKPQGQILASGSDDQTIRLWDTSTGECLKILPGHTQPVRAIAFSPQGELLVSGSEDCSMRMWDAYTGECRQILLGHTQSVLSVAFAWQSCAVIKAMPKGYIFASGSHDKTVRLWDAGTGQCLGTLSGHTNSVRAVAFSPESPILASGGEDQALRVWDITTGQCRKTLQGYTNPVWSVAFNPNGRLLASGSEDHTVKLWDVSTGRCCQLLRGHSSAVRSVAFSPDGTTLASGSEDHTVKLWDVSTGRCRKTLWGDGNRVWSIAFSPDGSTLASGHENHTVKLWDLETGQYLTILKGHNRDVASVAYGPSTGYANSSDSRLLASASRDRSLRLWDGKTGECLKVLQGHSDVVWCLSYSPDGRQLASASRDRTVKLWDVATGECLKTLAEHRNWLWCNAFSPDGRTLASGGNDWVVRLWDVATGQSLKTLEGHTECVRAIAFSPDSKILATSSDDETIRLWDFSTSECLLILRSERAYEGMNITGTTGLTEATIITLLALGAVENQQIGRLPEFTA